MKFQKLIYLLDNTSNRLSKFRTKNWVQINSDTRVMLNTNSQIEFKTNMLNSSLCIHFIEYSNSYSKILRGLLQFFKDEADDNITDPKLF